MKNIAIFWLLWYNEFDLNMYAIQNSGARSGTVIISFETNAAFGPDHGITNARVIKYLPVRSVFPGQIHVQNIRVVG